jgi:hypothetical protein
MVASLADWYGVVGFITGEVQQWAWVVSTIGRVNLRNGNDTESSAEMVIEINVTLHANIGESLLHDTGKMGLRIYHRKIFHYRPQQDTLRLWVRLFYLRRHSTEPANSVIVGL